LLPRYERTFVADRLGRSEVIVGTVPVVRGIPVSDEESRQTIVELPECSR